MFKSVSSILRFGPAAGFILALVFLLSQPLLAVFPSNPLAWQVNILLSPVFSDPMHLLLSLPGMDFWSAVALATALSIIGLILASSESRFVRARFIYAHAVMLALLPGTWATVGKQVALSGSYLPDIIDGNLALLPSVSSPLAAAVFGLVMLACLPLHAEVIRWGLLNRKHPVRSV